jgi:predicted nucleic acid-binding protein
MMNVYPDSSFVYALLRKQVTSKEAIEWMDDWNQSVPLSWLVSWEFRHSVELQGWLNFQNPALGIPIAEREAIQIRFKQALNDGIFILRSPDWPQVFMEAEVLTAKYAASHGIRQFDTLHLATAKHLGCDTFLTFDKIQAQIARAERLHVPFQS